MPANSANRSLHVYRWNLNSRSGLICSHTLILSVWIGLIFFSSTAIAGRWANGLFAVVSVHAGFGEGVAYPLLKKAYHVFLFAVLGGLPVSSPSLREPLLWRAVLWSFVIGALSEALQLGFSGRGPSFADVLLNGASGSVGGWIWIRVLLSRQKLAP